MNRLPATPHLRERRQRRRHATRPLPATLNRLPIHIVDISVGGLGFTTSVGLHPFDRYQVRIPTIGGELHATGHLVWCRIASPQPAAAGDDAAPVYRGGIRLDPLAAHDGELLLALLEDLRPPRAAAAS